MSDDGTKANLAALHRVLDSMADAITSIVTEHAESENAHAEKLKAQVILVTKILEFARPTVRALGTRPKIFESIPASACHLATWRGLLLTPSVTEKRSSNAAGPSQTPTALDVSKSYWYPFKDGSLVFLHEDGGLVELVYEDTWNAVPTLQTEWRATEQRISTELFCRTWTLDADPKKLAARLLGLMDAAGDRRKPTAKARALADKFRAIVTLL
jgi:hypothetical protein